MYQDKKGFLSPLLEAPGDNRSGHENLANVETKYDITTTLTYTESGKSVHGKYLTKYTDLDLPGADNTYSNYDVWAPESVWLLDGYEGNAYISTDTTLNEAAWKQYNGRYFAATAIDNDNTLSATKSAVITLADAESSNFRWYGYGCGTNIMVNETGKKLPPDIATTKRVETSYNSGSHIFNVTEKSGISASCEITSDFNYVKADNIPNSWQIVDDFPTDCMSAPQASNVHVYTKPLIDVIADDGTEISGTNDYRIDSTDITNQVTISRNSDGKFTVSSIDYNLVKAKRVYVEFSAPIKSWDSIPNQYKNGTSTTDVNNSTTTQISTSDKTSEATASAPFSINLNASPHINIIKTAHIDDINNNGKADYGEKISYSFVVKNNGECSLSNIRLSDSLLGFTNRKIADSLAIGESKTYEAPETVTVNVEQAQLGKIDNIATVKGTPPAGIADVTGTSTATVPTAMSKQSLSIEKQVDKTTIEANDARPGTKLTYSFIVTNTGEATIKDISIVDSMKSIGNVQVDKTTLKPNESATASVTYQITQSDIASGSVKNVAHATGTGIDNSTITSNNSSVTTAIVNQQTELTLSKTVDKQQLSGNEAHTGQELLYHFKITNDGNVTMTNVSISDQLRGIGMITMTWPNQSGILEAGQSATGTAKYAVNQSDIDNGSVTNIATATGTNESTGDTITSNTAKATTGIDRVLKIGVSKTADPTKISAQNALPGTNITYAISVKNNGNTTIDLTATDSMAEIGNLQLSKLRLAPGETATATAKHSITDSDINAGTVSNTVSVTGTTIDKTMSTSGKSTAETTIEKAAPKLTLEKTVDKTKLTADESKVGTKLTYTFKITNAGNVTINDINIADQLEGISDIKMHYPTTEGELVPGEIATGTATYAIQNSDIAMSHAYNTAQAHGKNKATGAEVDSNESTATTSIVRNMSLSLKKTSNPMKVLPIDAVPGTKITYTFEVKNTGNTTLTDIEINDEMKTIGTIKPQKRNLDPGEKTTATADYTLTQADIEAGHVTNTATAEGGIPDISVTSNKATVDTPIEKAISKLTLKKTVDKASLTGNEAKAGTKLTYSFKMTNEGNIPINDVNIIDKLTGLSNININWNGNNKTIPAGGTITGTATYMLTQEDVDAGTVKNTATATGTDSHGNKLTSTDNTATDITRTGKLETVKTADKTNITGDEAKPGTVITYTITVKNTGNVTLHNVTCDDTMKEIGKVALNKTELAPNETATGTATHTLTQADIDAGLVKNTVSSSADSPDSSKVVSNESSVTTTVSQNAQLDVEKTADITHIDANDAITGKKISYSLKITNTGNTTITDIELNDELVKDDLTIDWSRNNNHTLVPEQSITAKANYQITDSNIDNGIVENTAFATGKMTNGASVKSNTAKASTTIEKMKPSLSIVKTGTKQVSADDAKPGYEINFDFDIENTGNTTLKDIKIDDDLAGISDIKLDEATLDAGEKTTGKATYKITQMDIDAGVIKNTATASGTTPNNKTVKSNESEHDVTIDGKSALSIEKKVDKENVKGTVDELKKTTLTYSFIVKNTGQTTVSGVKIIDDMKGLSNITFSSKKTSTIDDNTNSDNKSKNENANSSNNDASDKSNNEEKNDKSSDIVLKPGEEIEATATYTITDDDIETGHITNMAKATGKAPNEDDIESTESEATTQIEKIDEQEHQQSNVPTDLMQTGVEIAFPIIAAFISIGCVIFLRRKQRNKR